MHRSPQRAPAGTSRCRMKLELQRRIAALRARRRRVRALLRRLPTRAGFARLPGVGRFATAVRARPWLWSFRTAQVVPALYAGAVIGLLPIPGQVPLAVMAVLALRANLPVAVALCFASNPLTMVPLASACYAAGHLLLDLAWPGAKAYQLDTALSALASGDFSGAGVALLSVAVGAPIVGLGAGALMHAIWLIGAWEARVFQRQIARLRAAVAAHEEREAARRTGPDNEGG